MLQDNEQQTSTAGTDEAMAPMQKHKLGYQELTALSTAELKKYAIEQGCKTTTVDGVVLVSSRDVEAIKDAAYSIYCHELKEAQKAAQAARERISHLGQAVNFEGIVKAGETYRSEWVDTSARCTYTVETLRLTSPDCEGYQTRQYDGLYSVLEFEAHETDDLLEYLKRSKYQHVPVLHGDIEGEALGKRCRICLFNPSAYDYCFKFRLVRNYHPRVSS